MGKSIHNDVLDIALNYLADQADTIVLMNGVEDPPVYANCIATADGGGTNHKLALATIDISATVPVDGDESGRKLPVPEEAEMTVDYSDDAIYVALLDSGTSKVLFVTSTTTQPVTIGNPITIPTWDIEMRVPV